MSTFVNAPFYLRTGDYIQVKGLAESQSLGTGPWSFTNASQVQVISTPNPPVLSNFGNTLSWYDSSGSNGLYSYEIWRSIGNQ
jgi:hypothetical protein